MNQNAKKWIEALRSGKYEQGQAALKTEDNKFCCLGVACDLYRKQVLKKGSDKVWKLVNVQTGIGKLKTFLGKEFFLPVEVQKWLGMNDHRGAIEIDGVRTIRLDQLNDNNKLTFNQIADHIEKNQDKMFVSEEVKEVVEVK